MTGNFLRPLGSSNGRGERQMRVVFPVSPFETSNVNFIKKFFCNKKCVYTLSFEVPSACWGAPNAWKMSTTRSATERTRFGVAFYVIETFSGYSKPAPYAWNVLSPNFKKLRVFEFLTQEFRGRIPAEIWRPEKISSRDRWSAKKLQILASKLVLVVDWIHWTAFWLRNSQRVVYKW